MDELYDAVLVFVATVVGGVWGLCVGYALRRPTRPQRRVLRAALDGYLDRPMMDEAGWEEAQRLRWGATLRD